jgi:serine/threonine protein phosphatase PrpC
MLQVEFAQKSHPGLVRETNEDALGCAAPENAEQARARGWLFALADGVGGHDDGEVASQLAVEKVTAGFRAASLAQPHASILPRLIQSANEAIYETALLARPGGSSMATTIVACALRFDRATICHAGDSRCYLIRRHRAICLTRDHTVSAEQVRLGLIPANESEGANSHLLSRSLGTSMFLNVETSEHQIFAGDLLIQCSDGLHRSVKPADIVRAIEEIPDLEAAAEELVALANRRDGSDNISLQLIRIQSVERVGMYRGRQYKIQ